MNEQNTRIYISSGYGNKPKATVYIKEDKYVIDIQTIEEMLLEMIIAKGYIIQKTNRQKYPRLIINQ